MLAGVDNSTSTIDGVDGGGDTALTTNVPLSTSATIGATTIEAVPVVDGTIFENGGTQAEGPCNDVV